MRDNGAHGRECEELFMYFGESVEIRRFGVLCVFGSKKSYRFLCNLPGKTR